MAKNVFKINDQWLLTGREGMFTQDAETIPGTGVESAPSAIQEPAANYTPAAATISALAERRVISDRRIPSLVNNQSGTSPTCSSISIPDLLKKTDLILKSDTQYATALKSNIEAFYDALVEKKDHDGAKKLIEDMDARLKLIEEKLSSG